MRTGTVVSLLFLSSVLAGCLVPGENDAGAMTAGEGASDTAWVAALASETAAGSAIASDDLQLIAIVGFEASEPDAIAFPALDAYLRARVAGHSDETLGDGRAPVWLYLYRVQGAVQWVAAHHDADGRGVTLQDGPLSGLSSYLAQFEAGEEITAGWLDSDDAAAKAAETIEAWRDSLGREGSTIMVLHHPAHLAAPYWGMRHTSAGGSEFAYALLDAEDGSPISATDAFEHPAPVQDSTVVLLTPAGEEDVSITVDAKYTGLAARVTPTAAANPLAHVHATLIGPDGADAGIDDSTWPEHITGRVTDAAPGTWTLRIGSWSDMDAANLLDEVEVAWCTDGARLDPLGLAAPPASCLG